MINRLVSIAMLLTVLALPHAALAKAPNAPAPVVSVAPLVTPDISGEVLGIMKEKVNYVLPYPGILMDNPLYFLKRFRDQILEKLIADPIRKSEFYILQADKFVNMGIFANDQNKPTLVGNSVTQAEKYMEQAVNGLLAIKKNGIAIPGSVIDRLEKSIAKHIEVLEELLTKVAASQKDAVASALTAVKKLQAELPKLK